MNATEEELKAHFEIYGYIDPFLDMGDDSLRTAKVECYMKCKELGIDRREEFIAMNKRMVNDMQKFIFNGVVVK